VTKFASHKALKVIATGKLTFDERVVVHRVDTAQRGALSLFACTQLTLGINFTKRLSLSRTLTFDPLE